jgi:hypothetical protein
MRLFPLKTWRARAREVRQLRSSSAAVRSARGSGAFTAHSRAAQREFKQWERRVTPYLEEVESATLKNQRGEHFAGEPLAARAKKLTDDLKALCEVDARHAADAERSHGEARELQSRAAKLHPKLRKEIEGNVKFARGKLGDALTTCNTLKEVDRSIAEAGARLKKASDRLEFAADIDAGISGLAIVAKRLEDRGIPATQAWRQYAKELESAAAHASEQHAAGLYDSAGRFLSEVRDVDAKIEMESHVQRRRALFEISEWLARPQLTPSITGPFGDSLKDLTGRTQQAGFLDEWRTLRGRISEDVRKRYIETVEWNQKEIERIHKLGQTPLRTLQLTSDPSSPRLDWGELEAFAKTMVRKCS